MRHLLFSLRLRLTLLILVSSLPAMGLAVLNGSKQIAAARQLAQEHMLSPVRRATAEHQMLMASTRQLLGTLAQLPEVRAGQAEACSALLARLLALDPIYANFTVADLTGDTVCSAVPLATPVNVSDHAWFTRTMEARDFAVGGYQIGPVTGAPIVSFGYPIRDGTGGMVAVASAELDIGWLRPSADNNALPHGAIYVIVDRQGTILARHPDGPDWIGQQAPEDSIVSLALSRSKEGLAEAPGVDGVTRLYGYAPLLVGGQPAAYVIVGLPLTLVYAEANQTLVSSLVILMGVTGLALLVAWLGGESALVRPVKAILAATRRMAKGDVHARTGMVYGVSELSQLARAVDEMAESLERQRQASNQAQAELELSEKRFRLITEHSSDGIALVGSDGKVLYQSNAAFRILGYTSEERVGRSGFELLHPDDMPWAKDRWAQLLQNDSTHMTTMLRMRHKDGSWRWIEVAVTNLLGELAVNAVVNNYRDVTERVRAVTELQMLAHAIEHTEAGVMIVDRHGVIEFVNPALERLSGYGREDLLGQTPRLLKSGAHSPEFYARLWDTLLAGRTYHDVLTNQTRDGRIIHVDELISPITDQHGTITHFVAIWNDISEQLQAEAERARLLEQVRSGRDRLQALARKLVEVQEIERRAVARELHDEIGQALTSLKLLLEVASILPEEGMKPRLGQARALVEQLAAQVHALSLALRPQVLDDLGLLPALLGLFEQYESRTAVRVTVEHRGLKNRRFAPSIETAAYRTVQEALTNVARHAGVPEVTVRLWADESTLGAQVEDLGRGFDAATALTSYASSGLGGMCERAAMLGGQIEIDSRPQAGTRITARFSLREADTGHGVDDLKPP